MNKTNINNILKITMIFIASLFGVILLTKGIIFIVNRIPETETKCRETYLTDPSHWGATRGLFIGYTDTTTVEEARKMAGDSVIYKGKKCTKINQ